MTKQIRHQKCVSSPSSPQVIPTCKQTKCDPRGVRGDKVEHKNKYVSRGSDGEVDVQCDAGTVWQKYTSLKWIAASDTQGVQDVANGWVVYKYEGGTPIAPEQCIEV